MNTRNWLGYETIDQVINSLQEHRGYKPLPDLDKPDIDKLGIIEKNILRNNKRMTTCFAGWMLKVGMAYQEKYAGKATGELEMSYWIRLQALAHAVIDREKDYPDLPERLDWEEEPTDSLDVQAPIGEKGTITDGHEQLAGQEKTLEQRVEQLEAMVKFLLSENKKRSNADTVTSKKRVSEASST